MYSKISFTCDYCHNEILEEVSVPDTNMEDNEGAFSEESIVCPDCRKPYNLSLNNRGGVVLVAINGAPREHSSVSTPYTTSEYHITDDEQQWWDDYEWYLSISQQTVYQYFTSSIESIKGMLSINIDDRHQTEVFNRMLYVQSIATMEAYLSDTLISRVVTDSMKLRELFDIDNELRKERYSISKFLKDEDFPKKRAKNYLSDIIYHNLPKVEVMYKKLLGVQFDYGDKNSKDELFLAIQTRHDFVHRNGKTKEGGDLKLVNKTDVSKIIENINQFILKIEKNLEGDDDIPF